jgi:hypothetical protein
MLVKIPEQHHRNRIPFIHGCLVIGVCLAVSTTDSAVTACAGVSQWLLIDICIPSKRQLLKHAVIANSATMPIYH